VQEAQQMNAIFVHLYSSVVASGLVFSRSRPLAVSWQFFVDSQPYGYQFDWRRTGIVICWSPNHGGSWKGITNRYSGN